MALEVFSGTSIPRELTTAAMEFLWTKWKTLHATGDLTLQRLVEESSYPLRQNCVFMMKLGDDFVYMYVGETMQREIGRNLSGTMLSANDTPLSRDYISVYRQVSERMQPVCMRYTSPRKQSGQIWQRLVLPIRIASDSVMLVVYSELISHHMEVYDHLFRTARDAMVIACPITNDVGHTVDGWVVMMNDAARTLLDFTGSIGNLRLSEMPQFSGIDFWGRLYAPKGSAGFAPLSMPNFEIELMRFPHVFGLRLHPKVMPQIRDGVPLVPA